MSAAFLRAKYGPVGDTTSGDYQDSKIHKHKKKKKKHKHAKHGQKGQNLRIIDDDLGWQDIQPTVSHADTDPVIVLQSAPIEEDEMLRHTRIRIDRNDGSGWVSSAGADASAGVATNEERHAPNPSSSDEDSDIDLDRDRVKSTVADAGLSQGPRDSDDDSDIDLDREQPTTHDSDVNERYDDAANDRHTQEAQGSRDRLDSDSESDDGGRSNRRGGSVGDEADDDVASASDEKIELSTGLHRAADFAAHAEMKRREEAARLKRMRSQSHGAAETVVRDKHGRRLTAQEIATIASEKKEESEELEWGTGLKQRRDQQHKQQEYESEKQRGFSRYADDSQMNDEMAAQDRWGDPMANYMAKKRKKRRQSGKDGIGSASFVPRPLYEGAPWINRFHIRPGYRWDGVDRSNGWESKLFRHQNAQQATANAAYKWSSENM